MFKDRAGKVVRVYDDLIIPVAIVEFSETLTAKIPIVYLIEIKEQAKEPVKEPEIPEGAKRITRNDFTQAITDATCPAFNGEFSDLIGSMSASIVGMEMTDNLFKDQDVIIMTEDQLVAALWDGCSPVNVDESVGSRMGLYKSLTVSITAIMKLRKLVEILFSEDCE
jgi:hypothetical protein